MRAEQKVFYLFSLLWTPMLSPKTTLTTRAIRCVAPLNIKMTHWEVNQWNRDKIGNQFNIECGRVSSFLSAWMHSEIDSHHIWKLVSDAQWTVVTYSDCIR